jgi:DAACS family dicarboxylate/amino acid:cation (Na+ or H+) symporter
MADDRSSQEERGPEASQPRPKGLALHWKILIGLALGAVGGLLANALLPRQEDGSPNPQLEAITYYVADPIGQVFLRLIFMVVIPLVFSALILGVAEIGDVRRLGRMGLLTLLFTVLFSGVAVVIALTLANTVRPGERLTAEQRTLLRARFEPRSETARAVAQARQAKDARDLLLDIIPPNPLQEMVGALDGSSPGGGMLAVMFFSLMVGIAITLAPQRTGPLVTVLQGVYDVCMVIIGLAMRLAPLGVAGLVFSLTALLGLDILTTLGWYVAAVVLGLGFHLVVVYSLAVFLFARMSPRRFFGRSSEAMLTAFGTSSSNATLPTSLRVGEQDLGLRPAVAKFVLTVGSTANQNGTALYEGITVLFLAQVFGVELTLTQQVTVVLLSVLAGIGTAGVPGGSLPLVAMVLVSVGVPPEGIGIILGVDRVLDMCRTTLNVTGDLAVAACVDRAEGAKAGSPGGAVEGKKV